MSSDFTILARGLKVLTATPTEEGGQVLNENFTLIDQRLGEGGFATPYGDYIVTIEHDDADTDIDRGNKLLAAYSQAAGYGPTAIKRAAVILPPGRYDLGTGQGTGTTTSQSNTTAAVYWSAQGVSNGGIELYYDDDAGAWIITSYDLGLRLVGSSSIADAYSDGSGHSCTLTGTYPNFTVDGWSVAGTDNPDYFYFHNRVGHGLTLDVPFVDLIGADEATTLITSRVNTRCCGTVEQWVDNIRLANLTIENMDTTYEPQGFTYDVCAFKTLSSATSYDVTSVTLRGNASIYAAAYDSLAGGQWSNCTVGNLGQAGIMDGRFTDCIGSFAIDGTIAGGEFVRCVGGDNSFANTILGGLFLGCVGGSQSFGFHRISGGTFMDCVGDDLAFGASGIGGGAFVRCTGGQSSFSGGDGAITGGSFVDCTGGDNSFGYDGISTIELFVEFVRCTGGSYSFGHSGIADGNFVDCVGLASSFSDAGVIAGGRFVRCVGQDYSFAGAYTITGGSFTDCVGGSSSFGAVIEDGTFLGCRGGAQAFGYGGISDGVFKNCVGGFGAFCGDPASDSGITGGNFDGCSADEGSFGYALLTGGRFTDCSASNDSFGVSSISGGQFVRCAGGDGSFDAPSGGSGGTYYQCSRAGIHITDSTLS